MKKATFFLGIIISLITINGFSQDGSLDTSFGIGGVVETDFYGFNDGSFAITQQSNGKIISAGKIEIEYDNYMASLVRYNIDGSLDNTFGDNGLVLNNLGGGLDNYSSIITLNNDNLITAGTYGSWGEKDFLIQKFLINGDVDSDFGENGIITTNFFNDNDTLLKIILQEDEKILAIGRSVQGLDYFISFVKYLPSGEIDTTFGINGKLSLDINNNYPSSISASLQNDNSIIVSFSEDINSENKVIKIFKLFENGTLDTFFGVDGIIEILHNNVMGISSTLKVDYNNKILVFSTYISDFEEYSTSLFRYTESGVLDSSFGENGRFDFNLAFIAHKIIIQSNSRILIGGGVPGFEGTTFVLKRLFNNGSIDNSLVEFEYSSFESSDLILQNDGKILATGGTYWFDGHTNFILVRYNNSPLSVSDFNLSNVSIHPNPSKDIFTIKHDLIDAEISYQVSDVVGKIILTGKMGTIQTNIDLSKVQAGMYFLNIQGNSYRLLKE